MKPGRELDALIAEKVMRITKSGNTDPKPYSTDIAAAWEVVEKLKWEYWHVQLHHYQGNKYGYVGWTFRMCQVDKEIEASSEVSAPHVICLAALNMGEEENET